MNAVFCYRMESTEKCEVVIQHFNGKYLKTPPGIPGESLLLLFFTLRLHHTFPIFPGSIISLALRKRLSNSIMVISHLRSVGQLDRLYALRFLTPEANCRSSGWIADGSIGLFLSLCRHLSLSLSAWWCSRCRLELLGQEETLLIFTLMPLCCSLQST